MGRIIVIMGVAGAGKTRVGRALAGTLGGAFLDADDFHPPANVAKMRAGQPLTDADREPWLEAIHARLHELAPTRHTVVLACSALKHAYRQHLANGLPNVRWVHLHVSRAVAQARMTQRADHFMPTRLIDSQFDALEAPAEALVVDAERPVDVVVDAIVRGLSLQR